MGARRRGGLEVLVDILCESQTGATKTSLVNRANLNSRLIEKYLEYLLEKSLLDSATTSSNPKRVIYRTTPKGQRLLEDYRKLSKLLEA